MMNKLYYIDPYLVRFEADLSGVDDNRCLLSATAFYPGGGGQPADSGKLLIEGLEYMVLDVSEDSFGDVWHITDRPVEHKDKVIGIIDWDKRFQYMRYHGLLHIVNALAMRDYEGWITGAQVATEYARIDFNISDFTRDMIPSFEENINKVISNNYPVNSEFISEEQFHGRPELVRTLVAKPPVKNGTIRIVTIGDFDAQACGGTHVHSTREIGLCKVDRFDNKGSKNKRFYFKLTADVATGEA
ncbi:MAG: alanyl-tRNA editing protein [Nitrospirae bacterium]|nr:alanyl-tRNA editing protein [Nitrospirota bacterium]